MANYVIICLEDTATIRIKDMKSHEYECIRPGTDMWELRINGKLRNVSKSLFYDDMYYIYISRPHTKRWGIVEVKNGFQQVWQSNDKNQNVDDRELARIYHVDDGLHKLLRGIEKDENEN